MELLRADSDQVVNVKSLSVDCRAESAGSKGQLVGLTLRAAITFALGLVAWLSLLLLEVLGLGLG